MEKSPISDIPSELLADVVAIDSFVFVEPPSQTKAKFFDDAIDNPTIHAGVGGYLSDEWAFICNY